MHEDRSPGTLRCRCARRSGTGVGIEGVVMLSRRGGAMAGRELVVWLGGPVRVGVVAGLVALAVRLVTVGSPAGGVGVLVLLSSLVAGKQIALARGASALRQPRVRLVVALGAVLVTAAVVAPVASASVYW